MVHGLSRGNELNRCKILPDDKSPLPSEKSPSVWGFRVEIRVANPSKMLMLLNMRGWPSPSPARVSSLQASSSGNVGGSGGACHILAHGDASTWLCDEEAASCVETQQMVLCTEPNDGMHCVLQDGLAIDGKPVWACAPSLESREAPQRSSRLHMSLVRRADA